MDKKIKSDIRDQHYYESVKYAKSITPTNQTKFLPSLQSLDIEDSVQQFYIWVGSQLVTVDMRLPLIKKQQVTDKNKAKCIGNHGSFMISHCVYYYKITKICVVIDQLNNYWK